MSSIPLRECNPLLGVPVSVRDADGRTRVVDLREAATWRFEAVGGVRQPVSYKGQRNWVGAWWFSKTGEFVPYESWVERDHVMLLDRSPDVACVVAQPMTLALAAGSHTPDFFVRGVEGDVTVVDVRPDSRIGEVDTAKFEQTAQACESVGWAYQRVGELEPVRAGNVRWLAAYRHPWCAHSRVAGLVDVAGALTGGRCSLDELVARLGGSPVGVLPVVFHHVWRGDLVMDESVSLSGSSEVWQVRS